MSNPRFNAIETIGSRNAAYNKPIMHAVHSKTFGARVFNRRVMKKMLPKEVYENVLAAMEGREKIKQQYADTIADAMKEWAVSKGATHYSHWFQPLTGASAEKHDAFIEHSSDDSMIEKFSGKQLIQGEPDASSFPSGGLRTTFEARGYTGWDPTSPVFLWKAGDGVTLCIPSIFFSWTGTVLDNKIPLLRSDKKINDATLRLLKLTGIKAKGVYSTLGPEQEYFVVDRTLRNLRPDLVLLGRTVMGASPSKGQELQDHYFGAVKDRILCYMHEFETIALELGIPVKTRHNEVAPAQHEVAPIYEKASIAIDHNILLMELMRQVAARHDLACLLHEKPFAGVNGSGKHCNWSLATDTGINLLDPTNTPENNLHFLVLLTAILCAIQKHANLLRASIGSAANDFRLGGHEAPPAIMSVYLGGELDHLLDMMEANIAKVSKEKAKYNLGLDIIPDLTKDHTDRNRTSPFAFTGNKFEFRAVGSSASPSMPVTVLNVIVAESLNEICEAIEKALHKKKDLLTTILSVLVPYIKHSKKVRFAGDNYSAAWAKEAAKRGMANITKSIDSFDAIKSPQTIKAFEGVLTKEELISRYEVQMETYSHTVNIEAKTILDLFKTQVLPAAIRQQKMVAKAIAEAEALILAKHFKKQKEYLLRLAQQIERGMTISEELELLREKVDSLPLEKRAKAFCEKVFPVINELREVCDFIETVVDDSIWPLPKYRELMFLI